MTTRKRLKLPRNAVWPKWVPLCEPGTGREFSLLDVFKGEAAIFVRSKLRKSIHAGVNTDPDTWNDLMARLGYTRVVECELWPHEEVDRG